MPVRRLIACEFAGAPASRAAGNRGGESTAGFTLVELLTVLSIMAILLGISIGVFTRSTPTYELARNEILDKVRRARLHATAESSPASVILRPGDDARWPTISALGRTTVGMWHLEGANLSGFGGNVRGEGVEEDAQGVLGRAVRLAAGVPSSLQVGPAGSLESPHGFACEFFVKLDTDAPRTLVRKGDMCQLAVDSDGVLRASVELVEPTTVAGLRPGLVDVAVATDMPVLFPGRWVELGVSFDGLALRIQVDGATVAERTMQAFHDLSLDPKAPIAIGDRDSAFAGSVDEWKWGVYLEETSEEMVDMEVPAGRGPTLIRFAPGGELDGRFHSAPVELLLFNLEGEPLVVRVGLLGDVN